MFTLSKNEIFSWWETIVKEKLRITEIVYKLKQGKVIETEWQIKIRKL